VILTFLSSQYRPDFITLTACIMGIYFLENSESVRLNDFRKLVALIFISLGFDILWFMVNDYASDSSDGG